MANTMKNEMVDKINKQYDNKEITFEQWVNGLNAISNLFNNIDNGGNDGTNGGNIKKFSLNLKDYEPKKDKDGFYNYRSYNVNRKKYCYAVATNGLAVEFTKAVDIDFDGTYKTAKADFEKAYKYVAKDAR